MNPTIQPGMHPDAESLTAFAEQVLPAAEREEILAHMSTCGRCREVVFLAQQAAEEDQPEPLAAAVDAPTKPRTSWLNWRWAWIPATACVGLIGLAVMQHYRRTASETQTATNVAPTDALRAAGSPKAEVQKPLTQNEPKPPGLAKSSGVVEEREVAPQTSRRDETNQLEEKKLADQKDLALGAAPPPVLQAPGVAEGSIHGMMAARAKNAPVGGPSAQNEFQQQNMANQQSILRQSQSAQLDAANKTANAATTPGAESETITVQAQTKAQTQTQSMAPSAPRQTPTPASVSVLPATEQNDAISLAGAAGKRKKEKASLPNGHELLSMASAADRTIALDTQGALFLSEDSGKHWKPVRTQWTGRAVLLRSLNAADKGSTLSALKASPTAQFELVNDDLQTWQSTDGTIWTLRAMPGK